MQASIKISLHNKTRNKTKMPPKRKKTQLHEEGDAKTTPVLAEKRDDGGGEEEPTTAAAASACKRSRKDENEQPTTSGSNESASSPPAYDYGLLWECVGMLAEGDPQELTGEKPPVFADQPVPHALAATGDELLAAAAGEGLVWHEDAATTRERTVQVQEYQVEIEARVWRASPSAAEPNRFELTLVTNDAEQLQYTNIFSCRVSCCIVCCVSCAVCRVWEVMVGFLAQVYVRGGQGASQVPVSGRLRVQAPLRHERVHVRQQSSGRQGTRPPGRAVVGSSHPDQHPRRSQAALRRVRHRSVPLIELDGLNRINSPPPARAREITAKGYVRPS
jgi:hypothetical protein